MVIIALQLCIFTLNVEDFNLTFEWILNKFVVLGPSAYGSEISMSALNYLENLISEYVSSCFLSFLGMFILSLYILTNIAF